MSRKIVGYIFLFVLLLSTIRTSNAEISLWERAVQRGILLFATSTPVPTNTPVPPTNTPVPPTPTAVIIVVTPTFNPVQEADTVAPTIAITQVSQTITPSPTTKPDGGMILSLTNKDVLLGAVIIILLFAFFSKKKTEKIEEKEPAK